MITSAITPAKYISAPPPERTETSSLNGTVKVAQGFATIPLVLKLCAFLAQEKIEYCHWKSNNALDRSANGKNDLDLLINKADMARFSRLLFELNFKQAIAPPDKQMTGVADYFGYDVDADVLVHVHAHYQLMLGHDMTKGFRLPIEKAYLESAISNDIFRIPAPEFEYIVLVIRMALKHSTWDAILGREGALKKSEISELSDLQSLIDPKRVEEILQQHLPYIDSDLFARCVEGLRPDCSFWKRVKSAHQLQIQLQTYARYPLAIDTGLKLSRRVLIALKRRLFHSTAKYQLQSGGAIVALIGGDGAGKTTAIEALNAWLAKNFETTRLHLGRPKWSLTTQLVRILLKSGQLLGLYPHESSLDKTLEQNSPISSGYPWMLREVCTARDRYLVYLKAQRFVANGGIAILDRFPHERITLMDGPRTAIFLDRAQESVSSKRWLSPSPNSRFSKALVKLEKNFYQRIVPPDVLAVLVLDPNIAAARKVEEDPQQVHLRSSEVWKADWQTTNAYVVDASKSKEEVLVELKSLLWSRI